MNTIITDLLTRYDEWANERSDISERDGHDGGVSSSEWQGSDDDAFDLLEKAIAALRAPSPEAQTVLDLCRGEAQINAESGDVHTEADIASDIAQRLYTVYRTPAYDDGEPGPLHPCSTPASPGARP